MKSAPLVYPQSETEYQLGSKGGLTPPNESQNNQLLFTLNVNNQMNNNAAAVLAAALVSLQNMIAASREGRIILLPTFSR